MVYMVRDEIHVTKDRMGKISLGKEIEMTKELRYELYYNTLYATFKGHELVPAIVGIVYRFINEGIITLIRVGIFYKLQGR